MSSSSGLRADIDMLKASDKLAFDNLVAMCAVNGKNNSGIGTYSEKSVHFVLKNFFERDPDYHEVAYKGYVADIMRDGKITEIQTATLSGMHGKLDAFLTDTCVRIVFPILRKRHIVWIDPKTGETNRNSRSVTGESIYSLLCEMLYIVEYLRDPSLTVTAVELTADDYRYLNGRGRDRKKGARKIDCVPTELLSVRDLSIPEDLYLLVPESLPELFTRDEFARSVHLRGRALWAALKVLEEMRVIERAEPIGRKHRYRRRNN